MPEAFPLFGGPALFSAWKQTRLGIHYQAHGYDRPRSTRKREKRIKRALKYLTSIGVPEYVCNQFVAYYDAFPVALPNWLDDAYNQLWTNRWKPCIRKYPLLGSIVASQIRIDIVPAPFWVPEHNRLACGMLNPNTGQITLSVAAVSEGIAGAPPNWLRRVDDLARWEMGNWAAHYILKIRDREVGDGQLC